MILSLWDAGTGEVKIIDDFTVTKGNGLLFERMGTVVLKTALADSGESFLGVAYPNPSQDITFFTFGLSESGKVKLKVLDLGGNVIKVLTDKDLRLGRYEITWGNCTESGFKVVRRIYLYTLTVNKKVMSKKLVIN